MRDLIVSLAIVAVLIAGWLIFDNYSNESVKDMSDFIQSDIIPAVEKEDWDDGESMMSELKEKWDGYKNKALFFLNSEELSEIEYSLSKSDKYVKAQDVSNSSGELNSLAEQLKFIIEREKINLENIL